MLDHQTINEVARAMGVKTEALMALSPHNDPFYAGKSGRRKAAEWFADLVKSGSFGARYHIRRVHYQLANAATPIIKPDGSVYVNTYNDWKMLLLASRDARYLQLIPLDQIVDNRNPGVVVHSYARDDETTGPYIRVTGAWLWELSLSNELDVPALVLEGFDAEQKYLIEIWTEKSGQNDILSPLASRYGVGLINFDGESSEIGCRQAVQRALDARRPLRIIYASDFDPGGRSMPVAAARKLEYWLRRNHPELDVTVDPVALLPEQVKEYGLPAVPMKAGERRADKFRGDFGCDATELDALEALRPGELREIVERAILRHYDPTLQSRISEARQAIEAEIIEVEEEISAEFANQVEAAQQKYQEFREKAADLRKELRELWSAYEDELRARAPGVRAGQIPQPRDEDDQLAPLFDSKRDELTQLDWYRHWQRRGT
jgi:hypothetical protein